MSSPLGGYYISAINRKTRASFDLAKQINVLLSVSISFNGEVKLTSQHELIVGNDTVVENQQLSMQISSEILETGLLKLDCHINELTGSCCNLGQQIVNLSPNEQITTIIADSEDYKLSLMASAL